MTHRKHNYTNTHYDYTIINTYFSLMYELKIIGMVFTSKSVGTGPSSCEKRIYRTAVSQRLRNTGWRGVGVSGRGRHLSQCHFVQFESPSLLLFSRTPRLTLGPTQPPVQRVPECLPVGNAAGARS